MMVVRYYQEITILPSAELPAYAVWSKIFGQVHIKLAEAQNHEARGRIGVAFPKYENNAAKVGLGDTLRIFAESVDELDGLGLAGALQRYRDYVRIKVPRIIPRKTTCGYAVYSRYRFESSRSQKARRYAQRHDISYDEAEKLFPKDVRGKQPPYIQLKSSTNGSSFRLYIAKALKDEECRNGFSAYGLDNLSTVPEF